MGGTFSRCQYSKVMHLTEDEWLPAITQLGYPSWVRGPIDFLFKPITGRIRLPRQRLFYCETMQPPLDPEAAGEYATPLEMLRITPSAANR
jgi:hypothetical protein